MRRNPKLETRCQEMQREGTHNADRCLHCLREMDAEDEARSVRVTTPRHTAEDYRPANELMKASA